eukprot:scaffold83413_cov52-Cyclotella_meneghiniana.AAC.2
MTSILDEWMGKGFHPLVMIDSNSDINESKLKEFTDQNGLSDMITMGRDPSVAPPTYARGKQRIDFILGDEHIKRAIVHSGSLELHDGLKASDHTMQYLDLDEKLLFRDDSFTLMPGYHREFKLYDTKRKTKFQEYLQESYERQRIAERVEEIALKMEGKLSADGDDIDAYNKLDEEIVELIRSAAAKVGRVDFGYQLSPDLCITGKRIRMHKSIMSFIRNSIQYTEKLKSLAEELEYDLPEQESITMKQVLTNILEAWKEKRVIEKEDGEGRAKWLEEICRDIARESGADVDRVYKNMIQCALSKGVFKRLKEILKRSALDYIEVPNEIWYLDKNGDELYKFDNGIFVAHSRFEEDLYERYGSIKVPPKDVVVVDVEESEEAIHVKIPDSIQTWMWTKRNGRMADAEKQATFTANVYRKDSPPTTKEFEPILAEHGTSSITDEILNGTFDFEHLDISKEMKLFLRSL